MVRIFLAIAAILAGLAVAAGAFASHALRDKLSDRALEIFETASRYQMYHALALLLVAVLLTQVALPSTLLNTAGYAFLVGIMLFSGSLYALSLSGVKWLGAITPLGGVAFLIGWGCVAAAAWSFKF
ncbi:MULTISPECIES: DUF423 domain-containing protein [Trichocoleus]|uniref:DUF423 domain-containing protein n=1 Tax=Trichocoleus desertorum GB2-A4 TaxID=2933944 RepID=A0ABV0JDB4_9CYAN|nr:DUF423 domain-containing protein [Trichocoleus sp. FACHB-46]MBD1864422.1 DUF423 domain-containing protein [Trichocoleus sp. FACHB-46]